MKIITTKYTILPLLSSFILFAGCSTKDNIAVSETHLYNSNYGILPDSRADSIIASEIASENEPVEIDSSSIDPRYSTELEDNHDAFVAEDWVPPKPKITYKYMDDPKFYDEDELPENKLRTGNIASSEPEESTNQSTLYSRR